MSRVAILISLLLLPFVASADSHFGKVHIWERPEAYQKGTSYFIRAPWRARRYLNRVLIGSDRIRKIPGVLSVSSRTFGSLFHREIQVHIVDTSPKSYSRAREEVFQMAAEANRRLTR